MSYTYDIRPSSEVYRPAYEGSVVESHAYLVAYNVVGGAPQWGDAADASYGDALLEYVQWPENPDVTEAVRILPTADFAANADVTAVTALWVRWQHLGGGAKAAWSLRDRRDGTFVAGGDFITPPTAVGDTQLATSLGATGLSLLNNGFLCLDFRVYAYAAVPASLRVFDAWMTVNSPNPPPPPPSTGSRYLRPCRRFPRG